MWSAMNAVITATLAAALVSWIARASTNGQFSQDQVKVEVLTCPPHKELSPDASVEIRIWNGSSLEYVAKRTWKDPFLKDVTLHPHCILQSTADGLSLVCFYAPFSPFQLQLSRFRVDCKYVRFPDGNTKTAFGNATAVSHSATLFQCQSESSQQKNGQASEEGELKIYLQMDDSRQRIVDLPPANRTFRPVAVPSWPGAYFRGGDTGLHSVLQLIVIHDDSKDSSPSFQWRQAQCMVGTGATQSLQVGATLVKEEPAPSHTDTCTLWLYVAGGVVVVLVVVVVLGVLCWCRRGKNPGKDHTPCPCSTKAGVEEEGEGAESRGINMSLLNQDQDVHAQNEKNKHRVTL